jgi:hypothetical protein
LKQELGHNCLLGCCEDEGYKAGAWFLETTLTSTFAKENLYGPFPLCHLDSHYNNIIFDDDYNIPSILDWMNISPPLWS